MSIDQVSLENYFNTEDERLTRREQVYQALQDLGGHATSWQILNHLGHTNPNMVRPRLTELANALRVQKTDIKMVVNGITQRLWKVV